jgi:hypothetical protein
MSDAYTEDQLVEQPAIGLFAELGWTAVSAFLNLCRMCDLPLPRLLSGQLDLEANCGDPNSQSPGRRTR